MGRRQESDGERRREKEEKNITCLCSIVSVCHLMTVPDLSSFEPKI